MRQTRQAIVRMLLSEKRATQPAFYGEVFNRKQRGKLRTAMQVSLDEEVGMLRMAILAFHQQVQRGAEPEKVSQMSESLNVLGLACTRLARLINISQALHESDGSDMLARFDAVMQPLLFDMQSWNGMSQEGGQA